MKIAIITDTHAGARSDHPAFNEYFIKFYENLFFPYIKENDIRTVLHLGDVFDRRKYVNFNTLRSWQERVFKPLNSLVDQMDILIGNHDTYFKNTNLVNSVESLLTQYDKFKIHTSPAEVNIHGLNVLYLPWICEDNVEQSKKMISESKSQVCMGHLELMGFEMNAGHLNADKGLSPELFDKFFMTLTGHFHHKSSKGGIHYLGSPYPIYWNDWGDIRGFHILDTETLDLTFIENPAQMFAKIFYDDSKETFASLVNKDYSHLTGMFVKIIVQNKTNPYWFDQFNEALQKVNPVDISIVEASFDSGEIQDDALDETKDTLTILQEYVKSMSLQTHEPELLTLFSELYVEALNAADQIQGS